MTEPVARKVHLYGRVQGVFFRQWAVSQARELGVAGWVRNRPDGSVEAYLTGNEDAVSQMIERMRQGPFNARVDDFTVEEVAPEVVDGFSVRV